MGDPSNALGRPATTEVPRDEVAGEMQRILASPQFQGSARRRAFLRFIVDETLSGRGDKLKGFVIATNVFGRDETFDPQVDPVVRLEAHRLRRDLDGYYANAGQDDPVRISVPKGSYVPLFAHARTARRQTPQPGAPPPLPSGQAPARGPCVLVMPFEGLDGTDNGRYIGLGISHELISNLFRFPGLRLQAPVPATGGADVGEPAELGRRLSADYVVFGSVRLDSAEVRVVAHLLSMPSGRIVWTKTYSRPSNPQVLVRTQAEVAGEIATAIGQPYGAVLGDIDAQPFIPSVSNMKSYACVTRAYGFRRNFPRDEFESVVRDLEAAVERDPQYADAWAMLGWLHIDAGRLGFSGIGSSRQRDYEKGLSETSRAVALEPGNPLALKALAAAYHYTGRHEDSERIARQAADINPFDPEIPAQLGWRLAVRGKFAEGIPILRSAIERTLTPPSWYYYLIAIDLHRRGEHRQMLQVAERSALNDSGFGFLLLAIAHARLGNRAEVRTALGELSRDRVLASDPVDWMRQHGATDDIVEDLSKGLAYARALVSGP